MTNLRQQARGRECQVRIPGRCNFDPETSVLAHLNGAGMGMKHHDLHGAICCSSCHDSLDGRVRSGYNKDDLRLMHLDGMVRTQQIWIDEGFIG